MDETPYAQRRNHAVLADVDVASNRNFGDNDATLEPPTGWPHDRPLGDETILSHLDWGEVGSDYYLGFEDRLPVDLDVLGTTEDGLSRDDDPGLGHCRIRAATPQ